jgi:hypothetical protein
MAITPIRTASYVSVPYTESRANGYVTVFTAQGWEQWGQAIDSLGQAIADNQKDYEQKLKSYDALSKAIMDKRADITKKIADIQAKKAELIGKYQQKNAELAQKAARDAAQVPSTRTSSSGRWSVSEGRTLWNPKYKPEGGPAPTPRVVDPTLLGNATSIVGTADMSPEEKITEIANAAKASGGYNDAEAKDFAESFLKDSSFVSGMEVAPSQAEAGRRATRSAGVSTSTATGQTWAPYTPSKIEISKDPAVMEYEKAIGDLEGKLKESGLDVSKLQAPALEPVDLITTARQIYKEKFGDVPVATNLKVDGRSVAVLNNLMPFEVTNGMKRSVDFFKRYIDDSVTSARTAAINAGKEFTTNDLNYAVEEGKKRAREVLFGASAPGGSVIDELKGKTAWDLSGLKKPDYKFYNERVRDQLDQLAGMPKPYPPEAPIPSPTGPGVPNYFGDKTYSIGPKPEGEIPSYETTTPRNVAPTQPAEIPLTTPPTGLGGVKEPPGRGLEWTPPQPQWMPTVQPGLTPVPRGPATYVDQTSSVTNTKKQTLEQKDLTAKTDAFIAGTKAATENPKATAKAIVSDSVGKFVATLFDENKSKGANAKPVSTITEQLIKEYSGQPEKQKKAIQRYVELSTLDTNSKRIG